ncbi:MAG: hypothetical protein SV775_02095 [Thermodesulfobacteriota bacterium]|nr:hypothetical protein [Thermodesulfobacteriota bacterium]
MKESSGVIEVDLFPVEVNSPDHPQALYFKGLLCDVAEDYDCSLIYFEIDRGTVIFSFDSDELMAEILNILQDDMQSQP